MKALKLKQTIYEISKKDTSSPDNCVHLLMIHKALDEAIAELEALNNRSCEGCKHEKEKIKLSKYNCAPCPCRECVRHVGDKWEAEE